MQAKWMEYIWGLLKGCDSILSPDVECVWNHTFQRHVCLFCLVAETGFTFNLPFYQEIQVPLPLS